MAPGIGMPEMLVVLVLALVVVGPQQLPVLMRRIGRMLAQARGMAREFQASFDELGRETELSDLRKEIEALKRGNPIEEISGELDKAALEAQNDKIRQLKMASANRIGDSGFGAPQPPRPVPSKPMPSKPEPAKSEPSSPEPPRPDASRDTE
ncbi:Sec-independent protein translocase protein TatB [Maricaulis salignorans]|uniref:Sec-independent protein translocase protein TatB n=1 Tax=Maricaulis salignorans TaxID=144026 RepID=A0A1G9PXQ3_9PROT|nr:Sec-independent protein translocase protein TatB [Maricaulis salignorans]SDM02865.1 sec-independent protein translocase protein TatB [Maricaulis salignorans]